MGHLGAVPHRQKIGGTIEARDDCPPLERVTTPLVQTKLLAEHVRGPVKGRCRIAVSY
jgi:hypothetical protein